jgi:hypothetical protein
MANAKDSRRSGGNRPRENNTFVRNSQILKIIKELENGTKVDKSGD